jgi:hypothetical protein
MAVESLSPILFESVSNVTSTPSVELGTERKYAGETYRYIHHCGIATAAVGLGLTRPASAFAGLYSASVSSASGDVCVGFIKHAQMTPNQYGWALIRGLVTVAVSSGASSVAAGAIALGANGVVATHTSGLPCGQLLTAIVSGNSGSLYVQVS